MAIDLIERKVSPPSPKALSAAKPPSIEAGKASLIQEGRPKNTEKTENTIETSLLVDPVINNPILEDLELKPGQTLWISDNHQPFQVYCILPLLLYLSDLGIKIQITPDKSLHSLLECQLFLSIGPKAKQETNSRTMTCQKLMAFMNSQTEETTIQYSFPYLTIPIEHQYQWHQQIFRYNNDLRIAISLSDESGDSSFDNQRMNGLSSLIYLGKNQIFSFDDIDQISQDFVRGMGPKKGFIIKTGKDILAKASALLKIDCLITADINMAFLAGNLGISVYYIVPVKQEEFISKYSQALQAFPNVSYIYHADKLENTEFRKKFIHLFLKADEQKIKDTLRRVNQHLSKGQIQRGIWWAIHLLGMKPHSDKILTIVGQTLFYQKQYLKSLPYLMRYIRKNQKDTKIIKQTARNIEYCNQDTWLFKFLNHYVRKLPNDYSLLDEIDRYIKRNFSLLESHDYYRDYLRTFPNNERAQEKYAYVCIELGKIKPAKKIFEALHRHNPNNISSLKMLMVIANKEVNLEHGEHYFKQIINHPVLHKEAGIILDFCKNLSFYGDIKNAISVIENVCKLDPENANYIALKAFLYLLNDDPANALEELDEAFRLDPNNGHANALLGRISLLEGDYVMAQKHLEIGYKNYEHFDVQYSYELGISHLITGQLGLGFEYMRPLYISAKQEEELKHRTVISSWEGKLKKHLKLMIWSNSDLEDQLLFFTILPQLLQAGMQLGLRCDARLVTLMKRSYPSIDVSPFTENAAEFTNECKEYDRFINLFDLVVFLRSDAHNFRYQKGKIVKSHSTLRQKFRAEYARKEEFIVGICWERENNNSLNPQSISLLHFLQCFINLPIRLVSVQYHKHTEDIEGAERSSGLVIHQKSKIDSQQDLENYIGLIDACNLVITIDSPAADIAGALGRPCWVLLPYVCDWRYLTNRQDSLWYPSLRLFRQNEPGDWSIPLGQIRYMIENYAIARQASVNKHSSSQQKKLNKNNTGENNPGSSHSPIATSSSPPTSILPAPPTPSSFSKEEPKTIQKDILAQTAQKIDLINKPLN